MKEKKRDYNRLFGVHSLFVFLVIIQSELTFSQNLTLSYHADAVYGVAFSSDSSNDSYLALCSLDSYLNIWSYSDASWSLKKYLNNTGICRVLIQVRNGELAASSDQNVTIWSALSNLDEPITTLAGHSDNVLSLALSPDGLILASGSKDSTVKLWNYTSQTPELMTLSGHSSAVNTIVFVSDQALASGSSDRTIKIWNVTTGKHIFYFYF
jgi:WD40 repeat protein